MENYLEKLEQLLGEYDEAFGLKRMGIARKAVGQAFGLLRAMTRRLIEAEGINKTLCRRLLELEQLNADK